MRNWSEWLPRVLVESVLIVFSVLLALAVDEWQESRRHRAAGAAALRSIASELSNNRAQLALKLPYYACISDQIGGVIAARGGAAGFEPGALAGWSGISPPVLLSGSYEAAAQTGALSHVDFRVVNALSHIYTLQRGLDRVADHATGALLGGGMDQARQLHLLFTFFSEIGQEVVASYDEAGRELLSEHGYRVREPAGASLGCAGTPRAR